METQRTLVLLKPETLEQCLVGAVIHRLEQEGLEIVGCHLTTPTREMVEEHYAEHRGKEFFERVVSGMATHPVIALCLEGSDIIARVRITAGASRRNDDGTLSSIRNAMEAPAGTIRGDFAKSQQQNIIHASDSLEAAKREIRLWFWFMPELANF